MQPATKTRKIFSRDYSRKIKDAIEQAKRYKDRKLTKDEKGAVQYLVEGIEITSDYRRGDDNNKSNNNNDNKVNISKRNNPPKDTNYLKDSLKY